MFFSPLAYDEPLFRPPSEARSLIFQVTTGCSWNKCAFCEMYTSKKFRVKSENEIIREIEEASAWFPDARKVFLADGNAMVLSSARMLTILDKINAAFGKLARVSAYAGARDLQNKSEAELRELRDAGLKLIYVGIESGDDTLLSLIGKGETFASMEHNLLKAKSAGIKSSVMVITGLGGKVHSRSHAIASAHLVSSVQPEFLSTLVLSFPFGLEHFKKRFGGTFIQMDRDELLRELYLFIEHTTFDGVVFRSDHASNYLALKGVLGRDRARMLEEIHAALENPGMAALREEWQRGL